MKTCVSSLSIVLEVGSHEMSVRYARMLHRKCRRDVYPSSGVKRFEVPEEKVSWTVDYPEYRPAAYTAAVVYGKPWADPEIDEPDFKPRWNAVDGNRYFFSPRSSSGTRIIADRSREDATVERGSVIARAKYSYKFFYKFYRKFLKMMPRVQS